MDSIQAFCFEFQYDSNTHTHRRTRARTPTPTPPTQASKQTRAQTFKLSQNTTVTSLRGIKFRPCTIGQVCCNDARIWPQNLDLNAEGNSRASVSYFIFKREPNHRSISEPIDRNGPNETDTQLLDFSCIYLSMTFYPSFCCCNLMMLCECVMSVLGTTKHS